MSKSDIDYEKVAKSIQKMVEEAKDHRKQYKIAFIKGLLSGFGGVVGATLLVAVLLWVLSLFDQLPLLGRLVDSITATLNGR